MDDTILFAIGLVCLLSVGTGLQVNIEVKHAVVGVVLSVECLIDKDSSTAITSIMWASPTHRQRLFDLQHTESDVAELDDDFGKKAIITYNKTAQNTHFYIYKPQVQDGGLYWCQVFGITQQGTLTGATARETIAITAFSSGMPYISFKDKKMPSCHSNHKQRNIISTYHCGQLQFSCHVPRSFPLSKVVWDVSKCDNSIRNSAPNEPELASTLKPPPSKSNENKEGTVSTIVLEMDAACTINVSCTTTLHGFTREEFPGISSCITYYAEDCHKKNINSSITTIAVGTINSSITTIAVGTTTACLLFVALVVFYLRKRRTQAYTFTALYDKPNEKCLLT